MKCSTCGADIPTARLERSIRGRPRAERRYCSALCSEKSGSRAAAVRQRLRNATRMRRCIGCGKDFVGLYRRRCRKGCGRVHRWPGRPKTCQRCGRSFLTERPGQSFCGRACSDAVRRRPTPCQACGAPVARNDGHVVRYCAGCRPAPKLPKAPRWRMSRHPIRRSCAVCSRCFEAHRMDTRVCSPRCRSRERYWAHRDAQIDRVRSYKRRTGKVRPPQETRLCVGCGGPIPPPPADARRRRRREVFCSDRCARKESRAAGYISIVSLRRIGTAEAHDLEHAWRALRVARRAVHDAYTQGDTP